MKKLKWCEKLKSIYSTNKELLILTILGFICLIHICFTVFFCNYSCTARNTLDAVIRSQMSLIFGYIFGLQTVENVNISNKNLQFSIASSVALACLICLVIARWLNVLGATVAIASIRDLLVSSTGFIIGCSKDNAK